MPRKKDPPKPLLATKFDFVESLDNVIQQAIIFDQAVDMAFDLNKRNAEGGLIIPKAVADLIDERRAAFKSSIFQE